MKKTVSVSVGDLNGIGIELILRNHNLLKNKCNLIYCIDKKMLSQASDLLDISLPDDMILQEDIGIDIFDIQIGKVDKESGAYSFASFTKAVDMVENKQVDAILTMPIHKKAWEISSIKYKGHTDYLSHHYNKKGIMMLGCEDMYVALFSDHIPLKQVPKVIDYDRLKEFFINLYNSLGVENIAVLGVNPHSGDDGVLGDEDFIIQQAIDDTNIYLKKEVFKGTLVPDVAFTKLNRKKYKYFVAMYHDQGLIPLKALYFDESINITLSLPIKRASVDHGCAFDIAYNPHIKKNSQSYINAIDYLIK
jgi:4-hydroxythreonine-4-phosphate dehydrogenase